MVLTYKETLIIDKLIDEKPTYTVCISLVPLNY